MLRGRKKEHYSPEAISWVYHARELQIRAIAEELHQTLKEKFNAQLSDVLSLREILYTPPILMTDNRRCVLFEKAIQGVRLIHTIEGVKGVFEQVEGAITPEAPKVTSIVLVIKPSLIKALEAAFPKKDLLYESLIEGEKEAGDIILASLQGDQPLLRFRKDILSLATNLEPSVDGGSVALLHTKVPGIEVRYYYPPGQNFPLLSLEVNRLDRV